MRVAIDARGINWYKGTGIGTYTENILKHLLNIDKDNIYHLYWSGDDYDKYIQKNTRIIMASKKHQKFFEQYYFPYNLHKENIDLFHIPQNGIGLKGEGASRYVVTIHDLIPYIMPETVGRGYLNRFLKDMPYIMEKASGILTVSEYSKKDIMKFFGVEEDKIYVTPLAANDNFKPLDKELCKNKLNESFNINENFILYVGGFSTRKNVKTLINSFYSSNLCKDFLLVLPGSVKDEGIKLVDYTKTLGISDRVKFLGFCSEETLSLLYNCCSVFVYPSLYEGFGLPPLEAMSCGAPVIVSNLTSIPEVVSDNGIIINPYDEADLNKALIKVLSHSNFRAELSKKSLIRSQDFSWSVTAQNTLNAYNSIVEKL